MLAQANALPPGLIHEFPDSNAWAANGPKVSGAKSMLAGDPHLPQTVPSIWYQVALSAPGLSVTGVSVPGLPGVLIGHNAHIAWSLTDTQNQATLFYAEQTSRRRPGQFFHFDRSGCDLLPARARKGQDVVNHLRHLFRPFANYSDDALAFDIEPGGVIFQQDARKPIHRA